MKTVKELMTPLSGYTRVFDDASLFEAFEALEQARSSQTDPSRPWDRAVLIQSKDHQVIGKLSMWDLLNGLEPRYDHPIDPLAMVEDYGWWSRPLQNLAEKARLVKVKDLVRPFAESEKISQDASLDLAVNQLLIGQYLSLLVTQEGEVTGILRLSDVFREVSHMIKTAQPEPAQS
jgi:CBS domain containing-hemolysin-like protein